MVMIQRGSNEWIDEDQYRAEESNVEPILTSVEGNAMEVTFGFVIKLNDEGIRGNFKVKRVLLTKVPDHVLESNFLNGLGLKIWIELHRLKPKGLAHLMEVAKGIKEGKLC